jgi:cyclopropane fatty-acyl-phospholipid synthase-like methyltransferase
MSAKFHVWDPMFLLQTRRKAKLALKGFIFDKCELQELIDVRHRNTLEDSMGFRGQWEEHRRFQITFLKEQGLNPSHNFLEIGCGPLTGGIPIIKYLQPNNYFGVDIRSSVLNLAWGEIGAAGLSDKNPRLICSSSFGAEEFYDQQFDFVFSFSVLYHLSDQLLQAYFTQVAKRLTQKGACFAQVNTHLNSSTWLQFPFVKRTVDDYIASALAAGMKTKSLGTIESLGFRLPGEERLNEMLAFTRSDAPEIPKRQSADYHTSP